MRTKILFPGEKVTNCSFERFKKLSARYGHKVAGLCFIPDVWRPPFIGLPVDIHSKWLSQGSISDNALDAILKWAQNKEANKLIFRSSGITETISDRGEYKSQILESPFTRETVSESLIEVFKSAPPPGQSDRLGIAVQVYFRPDINGHFSNEARVSPTRNQWAYQIENPWAPQRGLNSKMAPLPDPSSPLPSHGSVPRQSLRALGKWLSNNIHPRCHLEWFCKGGVLWLVQLDLEWPQLDSEFDPKTEKPYAEENPPDLDAETQLLKKYVIGTETPWQKLQDLSNFDFDEDNAAPNIFQLPGKLIQSAEKDASLFSKLRKEISIITADRAVVRTDCNLSGFQTFNLQRTDTVNAEEALRSSIKTLKELMVEGAEPSDIMFLLHAFIPSFASAWSYHKLGSQEVIIHALWGLPDGMQFLPVDKYEFFIPHQKIIKTKSTFKPRFLREGDNGVWEYRNVRRTKGRSCVLSRPDIVEIANRTQEIALNINSDSQIMWFSGIPDKYQLGRNLPWFRSKEKLDDATPMVKSPYKEYAIREPSDLDKIPEGKITLQLMPDAGLIRNNSFLEAVIQKARESKLPVKLEGSTLSHAYYQLCKAGVGIVLANHPKYHRKRGQQKFAKIVRDKISKKILSGGEETVEATLRAEDARHGLAAKIVEEIEEFLRAGDKGKQLLELADVYEVLLGIAGKCELDWKDVSEAAHRKRKESGGFSNLKVLLETSLPTPLDPTEAGNTLSLSQLGEILMTEDEVAVPLTKIVGTIGRQPLGVTYSGPELRLRFSLRVSDGKLFISRIRLIQAGSSGEQPKLFEN